MASWAYRVYEFKILAGNEELSQEIEEHREFLLNALNMVGETVRVGKPRRNLNVTDKELDVELLEEDFTNTEPTLSIRGCDYNKELSVIHASIALGERGLHDFAINPDEGDWLDVEDRSAETPRRIDFYFASAGFEGFIVSEAIGMKDPVALLEKWIRNLSAKKRKSLLDEISEKSNHFDSQGNKISKTKARALVPQSISIRARRLADPILLQAIINDIQSMEAEYIELDENNKETDKRLIVKVRESDTQRNLANIIFRSNTKTATEAIIKDTLSELNMDPDNLRTAQFDPKVVKARVQSSQGATTLVPGKLSDLFNYKFKGPGRPSNTPYYKTTLSKIEELKIPAQLPLAVPNDEAMIDWVKQEEEEWEHRKPPSDE